MVKSAIFQQPPKGSNHTNSGKTSHNEIFIRICYIGCGGNAQDNDVRFACHIKLHNNNNIFSRFDHICMSSIFCVLFPLQFSFQLCIQYNKFLMHHNCPTIHLLFFNWLHPLSWSQIAILTILTITIHLLQPDQPGFVKLDTIYHELIIIFINLLRMWLDLDILLISILGSIWARK